MFLQAFLLLMPSDGAWVGAEEVSDPGTRAVRLSEQGEYRWVNICTRSAFPPSVNLGLPA